jgi:hypothetical protein
VGGPPPTVGDGTAAVTDDGGRGAGGTRALGSGAVLATTAVAGVAGADKAVNEEAADNSKKDQKKPARAMAMGHGHGFRAQSSPVESAYLVVKDGEQPAEAPEVYYRFTARTFERHGGVPLASTYHKAEVTKDENGLWRADLIGNKFGTMEIYSRYVLGGETVYSQFNFLHYANEEELSGAPDPEIVPGLPADWPVLEFPSSKYNEMPFRGTQTENQVDFALLRNGQKVSPEKSLLVETKKSPFPPETIGFDGSTLKYTLSPADDPRLAVTSGPMGGMSGSKSMVALINLPNNEAVTFTLNVTRSKWSYRKLGYGVLFALCVAAIAGIVTAERRRKFKYNESD